VEVIAVADAGFRSLGLDGFRLEITSLGDESCRPQYRELLQEFLFALDLDQETRKRAEINPLRVLDDKRPAVRALTADAPVLRFVPFQVGETLVIGVFGYLLLRLGFHPAPILLGFVLGPRFEENFRRAMLISRGDLGVFVERPISAVFIALCTILIGSQIYFRLRGVKADLEPAAETAVSREVPTELAAQRVPATPAE